MKKKANILINSLLTLTLTSIVFISMAQNNDQVHHFETIVFEQEVPYTYMEYTIELFDEDMDGIFDHYIDNPIQYSSDNFIQTINDRMGGLTGFQYNPAKSTLEDNEVSFWEHFISILFGGGYTMSGTDIYVIDIELPNFDKTYEYSIELDFEKTWEYDSPEGNSFFTDRIVRCGWQDLQQYCDYTEDPDNYNITYVVSDTSRGTLVETTP